MLSLQGHILRSLGRESTSEGGRGGAGLALTAMLLSDAKTAERAQALQQERTELRGQIAACWQELEHGSPHRARREQLEWQIRKAEKRLAEIGTRLAAIRLEAP